MKKYCNNI